MLTLDNLPIFITVMVIIIAGVSLLPVVALIRGSAQRRQLMETGLIGQAVILKIWDTGVTVNDNPQVGFLLEVQPAGGAPFQAETKMLVSRLQVSQFQPGALVQVRYARQSSGYRAAIVGPLHAWA